MPFFKHAKTREPWFKWAEEESKKTGLRCSIFTPDGNKYKGEWLKNQKSGKGAQLKVNGIQYEGEWLYDLQHGWGVTSKRVPEEKTFKLIYTGDHCKGKPHGFGYKHYKKGSYYEGEFFEGKRKGYGRCWYPNGSFYEGFWKNDKYHGNGMLVQANGNRYEGQWSNGVKEGWGRFFHLDSGQMQEGFWCKGGAVTSFMQDISWRKASIDPTFYSIPTHELQEKVPCLVFLQKAKDKILEYQESGQFCKYGYC